MAIEEPDMNAWLAQAKESEQAPNIGMFLIHNGIVRATPVMLFAQKLRVLPRHLSAMRAWSP